jgi:hypothetical protein
MNTPNLICRCQRSPRPIPGQKVSKNLFTIFARKVDVMQCYAQISSNPLRVGKIDSSGTVLVCIIPVGHVQRFNVIAGALQTQRGDGRINPAGKGNDNGLSVRSHAAGF